MKKILILGNCGYIGSRLSLQLKKQFLVQGVDLNTHDITQIGTDYKNLSPKYIQSFDCAIILAAHSSVNNSIDFNSSFKNTVINYQQFLQKTSNTQQIIVASTGGVYSINDLHRLNIQSDMINNEIQHAYDLNKKLLQMVNLAYKDKNIIVLRFGTVNGWSPNLRSQLMINSMTYSSINNKCIFIKNPNTNRAILGLSDLCRAMKVIINTSYHSETYNLASFNLSILDIAKQVASVMNVQIIDQTISEKCQTYDYMLDNTKFKEKFNFQFNDTPVSITNQICKRYKQVQYFNDRNKVFLY